MPVIGREPPADIVVPAPQVSARHAEIRHIGGELYELVDLESTNGTYVRGERVQRVTVRLDDPVRLGSFPIDLRAFANRIPRVEAERPATAAPKAFAPAPAPVEPPVAATPKVLVPAPALVESPPGPKTSSAGLPPAARLAEPSPAPAPIGANDLSAALAAQKSFVGKAFLVWFLYWLFWIPGFVMNLAFLFEANRVKAMAGRSPSGRGCLIALLWIYVVVPIVAVVLLLTVGSALLGSLLSGFR